MAMTMDQMMSSMAGMHAQNYAYDMQLAQYFQGIGSTYASMAQSEYQMYLQHAGQVAGMGQMPGAAPGGMAPGGMAPGGMPQGGMPQGGMPQGGMPQGGMLPGGMPQGGMPQGGMPQGGMPQGGMLPGGFSQGAMTPGMAQPMAPGMAAQPTMPGM